MSRYTAQMARFATVQALHEAGVQLGGDPEAPCAQPRCRHRWGDHRLVPADAEDLHLGGLILCPAPGRSVDDRIDDWHTGPRELDDVSLHDYLGMTWEEYTVWVMNGTVPEHDESRVGCSCFSTWDAESGRNSGR